MVSLVTVQDHGRDVLTKIDQALLGYEKYTYMDEDEFNLRVMKTK